MSVEIAIHNPEIQPRKTLLEIGEDIGALDELLDEMGGEITDPEVEAMLDKWVAEIGQQREEKIDSYCSLIEELEGRAKVRAMAIERMQKLVKRDTGVSSNLKERLKLFFQQTKTQKIETERFRVSLCKNGGKLPLIVYEHAVPAAFTKIVTTTDKEKIRQTLEAGEKLHFAWLGDRGENLRIS